MRLALAFPAVALFCLSPMVASAQSPVNPDSPPAYEKVDGLVWAKPQGFELKADLYLPKGNGPFPAIVFLHGGGFTDRNRAQLRRQAAHMATLGMVGFAIEYRVAKEAPYPAAVYDAKAAVRWLRANAAEYHIDPEHILAVGSSAGGHLAAMLGTTGDDPKFEVLDLTKMEHRESMVTRFLGGKCTDKPDICIEASPLAHASKSTVPMLILHGTADETVPYPQATAMVEKLKAAGARVELFTAPEGAHTFWSTAKWYAPSERAMEDFLKRLAGR